MTGRRKSKSSVVKDNVVDHSPDVSEEKPAEISPDDNAPSKSAVASPKPNRLKSLPKFYWQHKFWTIPASVVVLLLLLLAVPYSRYKLVGLFVKGQLNVSVVDSSTNKPVSDASLYFGSASVKTAANGSATLNNLPLGNGTLSVVKQYYKSVNESVTVSYDKSHNSITVHLSATGWQVPITVTNSITGKPVVNAEVKVLDTSAKTDKQGQAIIVLPIGKQTLSGTIRADNFNNTDATIQVTTQTVPANTFKLTPVGHAYFLSNLSGKIDVVQTNLDGSDRQTIVAGTGNESSYGTTLLASGDQKYLALLAQRKPTGNPELDLINTSTGKLSNIDEGNATFTLTGWVGDHFIYTVNRQGPNYPNNGPPGTQAIKSFNANTGQLKTLDQTQLSGSWPNNYQLASFTPVYITNGKLLYSSSWNISYWSYLPQWYHGPWHASVITVNPDGSNRKDLADIPVLTWSQYSQITFKPTGPQTYFIEAYSEPTTPTAGTGFSFYKYQNGLVSLTSYSQNQFDTVSSGSPTYFASPDGDQLLWSEYTDGKYTISVGDQSAQNAKQIATQSDYTLIGWDTDNYVLVTKNNNELYIMPASGGTPQFVSDFYTATNPRYGNNY